MASKSGYKTTLTIGATVTELTDVSITVNHEPIEVSDLASVWKERTFGMMDFELTAKRNYVSTHFLKTAATSAGVQTVNLTVVDPASVTVFQGTGMITRATLNMPMGAITEDITFQGAGSVPTIA